MTADIEYRSKLVTADDAVRAIPTGANVAMGMAVAEPPALLSALAVRVEARELAGFNLWYFHSLLHAGMSVLRYDLLDRSLMKSESVPLPELRIDLKIYSNAPFQFRLQSE